MIESETEVEGAFTDFLWYLAHPYSSKLSGMQERYLEEVENFQKCAKIAWTLLKRGIRVYAPIVHTHPIHIQALKERLISKEEEYELYMPLDYMFARRCNGLILAEGWEDSKGCGMEYLWFKEWNKPIRYITNNGNFV